jgi:lysophospholipase
MNSHAFARRGHPPGAVFSVWTAPDGWRIRRMEWPQADGDGARGSIFFANGRGDFIEKYLEPLAHWHRAGWNVASFDWRGQGESRGHIAGGHLDSFDPLVRDAGQMMAEWLEATPGPHVVMGHSMGGHLILRLLAEQELKVDAGVLIAPMIGINASPVPPWLSGAAARFLSLIGLRKRRAWKHNERPTLPGKSRQRYLTTCADRYADELWWKAQSPGFDLGPPSWGWLDAAFRSIAKVTPAALRRVEMPVLIVGTDADRLVSPTAIRRAARIMPCAELMMFPKAAHEILRESDAVRMAALERIDAFLAKHAR